MPALLSLMDVRWTTANGVYQLIYPRSVAEFSPGKSFVPACPRSVTESSLGDGIFFFLPPRTAARTWW